MSLIAGWLLAPLVLALLCVGIGLLLETVARTRVPGPMLPGLGLSGLIVLAGLLTIGDWSAELAAPACGVAAIAGLWLGRRRLTLPVWPVVTAAAAFALAAWPSLGTGQGSVAGYIKLDDSAIWLGLIAHVMEHGRHIADVPPSTFQLDLRYWIGTGYPVGTFLPFGVAAKLSGQDYANAYQPALAVSVAIAALGYYGCARQVLARRWAACAVAVVAVQASLFAGYVQWGSIKEVTLTALLPALAGLVVAGGWRMQVLAAVVIAAILDGFGVGGLVWAVAALVTGAVLVREVRAPLIGLVTFAVLALPAWATVQRNAHEVTQGAPTQDGDLGKLIAPLNALQGTGLWPAGDFRTPPDPRWPAVVLALLGIGLAGAAVAVALRRRAWRLPALVAVTVGAAIPVSVVGAPWIDAKILSTTAPVLLAAAMVGALLFRRTQVLAAVLAAAALVSAWLVARDVYVAPRDELTELRSLGGRLAGKGPTLVLNYEGYGTRYFLGPAQDEGISDLRVNLIPNRSGEAFADFTTAEIDDVQQSALFSYPRVVRRVTPVGSRPPSGFAPVWRGRFFEAWRRDRAALPTRHVPLGTPLQPGGSLTCVQAREEATGARRIAAAPIVNPVVVALADGTLPADWRAGDLVRPRSDGRGVVSVTTPDAGRWRIWVGGAVLGKLRVSVDGHRVGSLRHQLDASVGWLRFGARQLGPGPHRVTLDYERGWGAGRGSADGQLPLGPVALSREDQPPVVRLAAKDVDRLCDGRTYDWLETFD